MWVPLLLLESEFSGGAGRTNYLRTEPNEPDNPRRSCCRTLDRIETYPKAVIAAINGLSQGGGNEMASPVTSASRLTLQHSYSRDSRRGVARMGGAMHRRIVGRAHTLDMLTAREVSAPEALVMGMVNEVHLVLTLHP